MQLSKTTAAQLRPSVIYCPCKPGKHTFLTGQRAISQIRCFVAWLISLLATTFVLVLYE